MDFKRARTKEQIEQRQFDIMRACEALFEQGGYEAVNIKRIAAMTDITRSSIYTYYKTKDEIILDLLQEELTDWQEQMQIWSSKTTPLNKADFCREFTKILVERDRMLQYYCLLYTLLEVNCRIEKLVSFKRKAVPVMDVLVQIMLAHFPDFTEEQAFLTVEEIVFYILGLYPATHFTQKQKEAIALSETGYSVSDFARLCEKGIFSFLNQS